MEISKSELYIWCESQADQHLNLLKALAAIPAPSHHEHARAEFIRSWLVENCAANVCIDNA